VRNAVDEASTAGKELNKMNHKEDVKKKKTNFHPNFLSYLLMPVLVLQTGIAEDDLPTERETVEARPAASISSTSYYLSEPEAPRSPHPAVRLFHERGETPRIHSIEWLIRSGKVARSSANRGRSSARRTAISTYSSIVGAIRSRSPRWASGLAPCRAMHVRPARGTPIHSESQIVLHPE
jgi:hypothetical protein